MPRCAVWASANAAAKSGKKAGDDTMCPSFMVTHEERHTTRGRAHHLWEMLNGDVIADGWRDESVKEALDLCLACKGCKGDCPVNVDMATYKAEFLSHYWEGRVRPRHAYAFGLIDQWARLASLAPGFVNLFTQLPGLLNTIAKKAAGMPLEREIPAFAPETFKSWFRKRAATQSGPADGHSLGRHLQQLLLSRDRAGRGRGAGARGLSGAAFPMQHSVLRTPAL